MGKLKKFWNAVDEEMKERRKPFILLGNLLRVNKNQITIAQADMLSRERDFISSVSKDALTGHGLPLILQKNLTKMLLKDWYNKLSIRERFFVDGVATERITVSEIPMKVARDMCNHSVYVSYDMFRKCQELALDAIPPHTLAERYKKYLKEEEKKAEERRAQIRKEIEAESEAKLSAAEAEYPGEKLDIDDDGNFVPANKIDGATSDELPDKLNLDENGHVVGMSLDEIEERCKDDELPDKL